MLFCTLSPLGTNSKPAMAIYRVCNGGLGLFSLYDMFKLAIKSQILKCTLASLSF